LLLDLFSTYYLGQDATRPDRAQPAPAAGGQRIGRLRTRHLAKYTHGQRFESAAYPQFRGWFVTGAVPDDPCTSELTSFAGVAGACIPGYVVLSVDKPG
jgi:hypothetical protein